ncbi:MAG: TatD family hydrolase [Bacteroidota bacterium]
MFTETHTHLYSEEFKPDRRALIEKAISEGVTRFYMPNIDSSSVEGMLEVEAQFPEYCFPMMGLHPCSVNEKVELELATVNEWLAKRKFTAVGEIGLDLYWDKTFFEQQKHAFKTQIGWALDYGYPIVIHCRSAFDEIYEILVQFPRLPKAIFHCFSGDLEQANKIIALGNFKLGIGGVVTFKNAGLDKVVEQVDLEHLVLETDAPYLAPVPYRGKRNEPVYLLEVAKKIAALKKITIEEVGLVTSKNADFIYR